MACATLKRSLDWENLNQHPTKRRRCSWQTSAPTSSSNNINVQNSPSSSSPRTNVPSAFSDAHVTKISPEKMATDIRNEIKRLHKRKQLPFSVESVECMQESESSGSEMGNSPRRPESPPSMVRNPEKALFTFKQVQLICERMLKEREEEIREKYDAVLNTKLAEQYDAFVKFTYDQIQKRYDAAPSYLS